MRLFGIFTVAEFAVKTVVFVPVEVLNDIPVGEFGPCWSREYLRFFLI